MNWHAETPGGYDPDLVAAYLDGELEGRDEFAPLRRRVEAWLSEHPEVRADFAEHRRLGQMWQLTSPAEPSPWQWRQLLQRLHGRPPEADQSRGRLIRYRWALTGAVAAVAACLLAILLMRPEDQNPRHPFVNLLPAANQGENLEVFSVAQAHEVVILNVQGADTSTVVVGELPVKGPLELATRDEISVTHMQPCQRDNMVPRVRGQHPMIWAVLDSERNGE